MDMEQAKKEIIEVADELDRRGLTAEANEATRILAQIVDEEKAVQGPTPEQLMAYADQLDQAGRLDEADQVTAYAHQTAMVRSAQIEIKKPKETPQEKKRKEFWDQETNKAFFADPGVQTGSGPMPQGGEWKAWESMKSLFGGGPALFQEWKRSVWDKMTPVQQEDYRARTGMGSIAKSVNQELYDHWSRNIAPDLRKRYIGTEIPGRRTSPQQAGAANPSDAQYSMPASDIQARIEQKKREIQFLENTLAQQKARAVKSPGAPATTR